MIDIFVVGSYVEGLTIRVPRVPALGESLVGNSFDMGPGGKGTNQAIASARLGASVNLLACIGDDIFGERALELYQTENIALDAIHKVREAYTGIGFVNVLPSGENWITVDMGANLHMTPDDVINCESLIAQSNILMTQFEVPETTVATALKLAKKHKITSILNPAPARPTNPTLFADVDVLTPNATEARILLGLSPDDSAPPENLARQLLDYGVGTVVITQGKDGALIVTQTDVIHVPSVTIQAVDVTGAGDSFNASLAVHLGQNMTIEEAVQEAIYSGAYTAMHLGVIDGLPTREQLVQFKQGHT